MSLVYLISDYQQGSFKIGLLRSKWLNALGKPEIIDITHDIHLNNTIEAAFVEKQIQYPENLNIITVLKIGEQKESIVYQHSDRLYILPNNGLIGMLFEKFDPSRAYLIDSRNETDAARLYLENKLDRLEKAGQRLHIRSLKKVQFTSNIAVAEMVYFDKHGNCYFNITKDQFSEFVGDKKFQIKVQHQVNFFFDEIKESVNDVEPGLSLLRFSNSGYLKLQINMGDAKKLFRVKEDTKIIIETK